MSIAVVSVSPDPATETLTFTEAIVVDIRSSVVFRRIMIAIAFPGEGKTELAYAQDPAGGSATLFEEPYGQSTIATVTDPGWYHYQFTLVRSPMWRSAPKLEIWAFDTAGGEL
jgi:hypothetical protein